MSKSVTALAREAGQIAAQADRENRERTPEEAEQIKSLLDEAQGKALIAKQMRQLDPESPEARVMISGDGSDGPGSGTNPGEAFVQSAGFKRISNPGTRGQTWTSGAVEVSSGPLGYQSKSGTLFEGGQGAGLVPVPQVIPGIVDTLFQPLAVGDVFSSANATTSSVRYPIEGTATSGAAGVAEGGVKPASDLTLSTVDEPIKKIATSLIISDELLEDATNVSSYLNSRLSLFVRLEEERQLLRGAGTNELVGVFGRSGINQYTKLAADDNTTALAKVISNTRGSSFLQPDAVILHPNQWLNMRLLRDGTGGTVGQYFGGGPFSGAYGGGGAPGLFGESIWNTRVVLSTHVGPGTALVGSFGQGARIFRRGGVTVEMSNSHASLFLTDEVAVRAEERLGLAVFRPQSFTEVRGLA